MQDETTQCNNSSESYRTMVSSGAACFVIQCGLTFQSVDQPCSVTIVRKATDHQVHVVLSVL